MELAGDMFNSGSGNCSIANPLLFGRIRGRIASGGHVALEASVPTWNRPVKSLVSIQGIRSLCLN